MRKSRRRHVIPLAVFALVAAAGIGGGLSVVAHAQTEITSCTSGTTAPIDCTITSGGATSTTVDFPSSIQAVVTLISGDTPTPTMTATSTSTPTPSDQWAVITYSVTCTSGGGSSTTNQSTNGASDDFAFGSGTSVTDTLTLGYGRPGSCTVNTLTATLEVNTGTSTTSPTLSTTTTGKISMELEWTPESSASTSTSSSSVSVSVIRGYDGKCLDDKGNSSANRAKVIIWGCNSSDSAQGFTYSGGELKHNGKCVNDQGNGGSGTHLILWSCNGASNEKWFHSGSDGEFLLTSQAHGLLCIDDPGNSKTNGTQLIVWKCKNSSNQHWT